MVVLDTNFIIDLMEGLSEAEEKAREIEDGSEEIRIPSPVIFELWEGIERSNSPLEEENKVSRILNSFIDIPLEKKHAKVSGRQSAELIERGEMLDPIDVLIGGIAASEGESVVTRDGHFERMQGVTVEKY